MKKLNILRNNFLYKQHRPVFIRAVEPNYNEILTDQIKTLSEKEKNKKNISNAYSAALEQVIVLIIQQK